MNCPNCFEKLKYIDTNSNLENAYCKYCQITYPLIENTKYAEAWTGSLCFSSYEEGIGITFIYTENPTLDLLNEAYDKILNLKDTEQRPSQLKPIVKLIHDALKERLREKLTYHELSELSTIEKDRVAYDPPNKGYNIEKLITEGLTEAFSTLSDETKLFIKTALPLIRQLKYVRNKSEHIIANKWTIPSYIHENLSKLPSEHSSVKLNLEWTKACFNFVVKLIQLILRDLNYSNERIYYFNKIF